MFGLKIGELDDILMEQEQFNFLKSGERSYVVDEDSSDGKEMDDEEKDEYDDNDEDEEKEEDE